MLTKEMHYQLERFLGAFSVECTEDDGDQSLGCLALNATLYLTEDKTSFYPFSNDQISCFLTVEISHNNLVKYILQSDHLKDGVVESTHHSLMTLTLSDLLRWLKSQFF